MLLHHCLLVKMKCWNIISNKAVQLKSWSEFSLNWCILWQCKFTPKAFPTSQHIKNQIESYLKTNKYQLDGTESAKLQKSVTSLSCKLQTWPTITRPDAVLPRPPPSCCTTTPALPGLGITWLSNVLNAHNSIFLKSVDQILMDWTIINQFRIK